MLCYCCEAFNIGDLYALAAVRARKTKPKVSVPGGFPEYQGFPDFYKHHLGLSTLYSSVKDGCELCTSIWQQCSPNLPPNLQSQPAGGEYQEQIFLGLSSWGPETQGMPYLTAKQRLARGAMRNLASFDVFMEQGIEPSGFQHLLTRAVSSDPTCERSLSIAADWLTSCMTTHRTCNRTSLQDQSLPTRVIAVGSSDPLQNPHLVITNGLRDSWAALSYCWGGDSAFVLKSTTLDDLCKGQISIEDFPRTLRDAVIVTRRLGLRYLWIDALCIMQDSTEDWATEAARMKDVYGGATVTISAANSRSTTAGMLHERRIPLTSSKIPWKSQGGNFTTSVFLRSASHFWDNSMKGEALNKRGWTLQESLLSPRSLTYGSQQMAWECQECKLDESGRPIHPGDKYRDKKFLQSILVGSLSLQERSMRNVTKFSLKIFPINYTIVPNSWHIKYHQLYCRWFAVTKEFTSRNLTIQTDVLPALSGIARAFQGALGDQYCAGLWKRDIIRGLMWTRQISSGKSTHRVAENYYAPTWSWASIRGGVISNSMEEEATWPYVSLEETARVIDVHITPRFADPLGQILDGYLILRAPFCSIEDPSSKPQSSAGFRNPVLESRVKKQLESAPFLSEFEQQHQYHLGQEFAILRIARDSRGEQHTIGNSITDRPGASLMVIETTGQQQDEYRRVGFLSVIVPGFPEADDIDVLLLAEMDNARWEWKQVRLV